jgi:hypothetical protein
MCDGDGSPLLEQIRLLKRQVTRLEEERENLIFNLKDLISIHKNLIARFEKLGEAMGK